MSGQLALEQLLGLIPEPNGTACRRLLDEYRTRIDTAPGSGANHQAWPGGYRDHLEEAMNLAIILHERLGALRPLGFPVSDALLVLFLHDLEKPWRHGPGGEVLAAKAAKAAFRLRLIEGHGITLSTEQRDALAHVEGEGDDYSPRRRAMSPLAGLCHMCDVASARLWPEHPLLSGDPWPGAARSLP